MTLFEELKRRKVFRVAGTYAVVAWILMQIGEVTFPALKIPEWVMSTLVVLLLSGFPIAIIFAWIFDKTPEGLIKTKGEVVNSDDDREWYTKKRTYFTVIGILSGFIIGIYGPQILNNETNQTKLKDGIQKLAILPFSNIRPNEETDFLGYALSDEIINRLGYLKSLIVRPATVVKKYRGVEISPEEVGQELEVDLILTGSYLKDNDRLRLNTELMNIAKNERVWSKSMTVNYNDIFAIQDSVAGSIITQLKGEISPGEQTQLPESIANPEAYELYLKAKAIDRVVISDTKRTVLLLQKSIELDDNYTPAWTLLAEMYNQLANYGIDPWVNLDKAENALIKAFDLNPDYESSYGIIISLFTDLNRIIEAYSYGVKGLRLYPNNPLIFDGLGYAFRYAGLLSESAEIYSKASSYFFEPDRSVSSKIYESRGYLYAGNYIKSRQKMDETINYANEEGTELSSYHLFYDGIDYLYNGDDKNAFRRFDETYQIDPLQIFAQYGQIYKLLSLGKNQKAISFIKEIEKVNIHDGEQTYRQIQFYAQLGQPKKALDKMKLTIERGFFPYPYFVSDRFLDPIRDEPRFSELMKIIKAKHIEFKTLYESTMDLSLFTDASD
jgi:TolB-like protein